MPKARLATLQRLPPFPTPRVIAALFDKSAINQGQVVANNIIGIYVRTSQYQIAGSRDRRSTYGVMFADVP